MSIRPWVIVESPDSRGLRAITIHGEKVDSAWSLRELRKVLRRLGYPEDMDLDDPSCVLWRGGGSSTWPGQGRRRYAVMVLMVLGLLASLGLHVVIGWPDALGALTFAQRLIGVLILVAAAVEGLAALAVIDYWGRRQLRISGAFVLLGVLISLATTSLLLFLWLEEREFIPALPFFISCGVVDMGHLRRHPPESVEGNTAPEEIRRRGRRNGSPVSRQSRIFDPLRTHSRSHAFQTEG